MSHGTIIATLARISINPKDATFLIFVKRCSTFSIVCFPFIRLGFSFRNLFYVLFYKIFIYHDIEVGSTKVLESPFSSLRFNEPLFNDILYNDVYTVRKVYVTHKNMLLEW